MSSAIGSVSSVSTMTYTTGRREMQAPPDPANMAKTLVTKMDSDGSGSVNVKELVDAVSNTTAGTATSNVGTSDLFTALDSDGNGEVNESELSSTLQTISDSIARANAMGGGGPPPGAGAMGGMPPAAAGERSGAAQSAAADTNGDGIVSQAERLAYYQSNGSSSSASTNTASTSAAAADGNSSLGGLGADTMRTIMQLAQTYGRNASGGGESTTQALSVSA